MIPREWIPTITGIGLILVPGYAILLVSWLTDRRHKKSGPTKTEV
jgi:hypothetical protein